MRGPEHYTAAGRAAREAAQHPSGSPEQASLAALAQAHATLAQTAALMAAYLKMPFSVQSAWESVTSGDGTLLALHAESPEDS